MKQPINQWNSQSTHQRVPESHRIDPIHKSPPGTPSMPWLRPIDSQDLPLNSISDNNSGNLMLNPSERHNAMVTDVTWQIESSNISAFQGYVAWCPVPIADSLTCGLHKSSVSTKYPWETSDFLLSTPFLCSLSHKYNYRWKAVPKPMVFGRLSQGL